MGGVRESLEEKTMVMAKAATALDCTGAAKDENGNGTRKEWWNMTDEDIKACIDEQTGAEQTMNTSEVAASQATSEQRQRCR